MGAQGIFLLLQMENGFVNVVLCIVKIWAFCAIFLLGMGTAISGVLYFPLLCCSISIWYTHITGERDSCCSGFAVQGARYRPRGISGCKATVSREYLQYIQAALPSMQLTCSCTYNRLLCFCVCCFDLKQR